MKSSNETAWMGGLAALLVACSGCAASGNRFPASEVGRPSSMAVGAEYGAWADGRGAAPAGRDDFDGDEVDALGVRRRKRRGGGLPMPWALPGSWPIPQGWSLPPAFPLPLPLPGPAPSPGKQRIPIPNAGAPAAVAYAKSKLGLPYCWGGSGPGCYDCSGLTSASWKAGGRVIPRTSEEQAERLPEVPLALVVPGDILWRPGHVALYIGNGQVIQAPHTGDVVKVSPAERFAKAVRP